MWVYIIIALLGYLMQYTRRNDCIWYSLVHYQDGFVHCQDGFVHCYVCTMYVYYVHTVICDLFKYIKLSCMEPLYSGLHLGQACLKRCPHFRGIAKATLNKWDIFIIIVKLRSCYDTCIPANCIYNNYYCTQYCCLWITNYYIFCGVIWLSHVTIQLCAIIVYYPIPMHSSVGPFYYTVYVPFHIRYDQL